MNMQKYSSSYHLTEIDIFLLMIPPPQFLNKDKHLQSLQGVLCCSSYLIRQRNPVILAQASPILLLIHL